MIFSCVVKVGPIEAEDCESKNELEEADDSMNDEGDEAACRIGSRTLVESEGHDGSKVLT